MSLFKARDWWQTQCGHGEEFDMGCLLVANIDNDSSGQVKIATGSFSGFLRVYLPRDRGYKPEDLLLETELEGGPILALAAGRFTGSGGLQLAVLHPRKLTVYSVAAQGGGAYLNLSRLYEHWLEHTAANMTYGPFGGVQGCDYICVQSYDGQVSFFEAEGAAFSRYLPNFLVPGPLAYVEACDSFVTCTAALELEAYKYKVIAAASSEKQAAKEVASPGRGTSSMGAAPSGAGSSKRVQADWKVVLGEAAIDIRVGRFSQGLGPHQADIVVLGEHNLFVLSSYSGQITFQKRLEYHPSCCTTYPVPGAKTPGGAENLLVATHTKALLVYRTTVLSWAAKHDLQPVAVAVADLPAMRGAIVALDDGGGLSVGYLGTDPLLNPVGGFSEGKDLDYEAMAREHRNLAQVIREHGGGGGGVQRIEPMDRLIMRAQIPQRLDAPRGGSMAGEDGLDDLSNLAGVTGGKRLTVRLYLALQGAHSCDNLTLTVSAPEPVVPAVPEISVPTVSNDPNDPTLVLLTFAPGAGCLPTASTALVVATYTSPGGEPRSQRLEIALPLCAFCTVVPPVKNAEFKVTLTTNRPPPPLGSLFEDALAAASPGVAQALSGGVGAALGLTSLGSSSAAGVGNSSATVMTFQFYGGLGDVTILVSKAGGRYRIQSDVLEGMWLVCRELGLRLARYYAEAEAGLPPPPEGPFAVSYEDALPLDDFFEVVEQHFAARLKVADLNSRLENSAVQFRNIEKRLLMRFKDKNPAPLNQLDLLMNETYGGLMELGNDMEAAQAAVTTAARRLSGCVQLLLLLIRWRFGLSEPEAAVMSGCIPAEVIDGSEVGWEETTEAAMTHLLRTCLAKNAKEQAVQVAPLAPVKNTERLRKHMSLVLERLTRGMRLMTPADIAAAAAAVAGGGAAAAAGGGAGVGAGRSLYREAPTMPLSPARGKAGGLAANAAGAPWPGLAAVAEEGDGASSAGQPGVMAGRAGGGGGGGLGAGAYDGSGVAAGFDRLTVVNGEDGAGGAGGGSGGGAGGGGFWSMDSEVGGNGGGGAGF
ncbi:hypothetical protein HYH02_003104 [Chlamydomonas schloesseri]|uniref:Bardet-Biedl syndrome 9 n=1 Tax=Chlamydomonas schloesseri TaxID=2026947 RepID=A0A835WQ75_9CHLO|nr:hypothetical protein HYH02_003104 [Chlamydomonas schloesseri]|eukprot:KAG2452068.1 hypothetical protein HYH02_003104 [Chlamydomonas schloesseri]